MNFKKVVLFSVALHFTIFLKPSTSNAQQCSQAEVEYLAANAELLADISQSCAFDCVLAQNQNECLLLCLSEQIPVSEGCLSCSVNQINCVLDNCAVPCLFPNSQACEDCISGSCLPDYFVCIGDDDIDGYTVEGGDCNILDDEINPSANDLEGDGIDQNCDGVDGIVVSVEDLSELEFRIYRKDNLLIIKSEISGNLSVFNAQGVLVFDGDIEGDEVIMREDYDGMLFYKFDV